MERKPTDKPTQRDMELLKLIFRKYDFVMWIGCNWQFQCGNHRFLSRVHKLGHEAHESKQRRWQYWMHIRLVRFCLVLQ